MLFRQLNRLYAGLTKNFYKKKNYLGWHFFYIYCKKIIVGNTIILD